MRFKYIKIVPLLVFCCGVSFTAFSQTESIHTTNKVAIDGIASESDWALAKWYPINQLAIGTDLDSTDFWGRFKSVWDENYLYLFVEVVDDSLSDDYINPLEHWWDDDCVEIFIDENNGKENHQYNHKAFAYHVAINGDVVDAGIDQKPVLFNNHVKSKIHQQDGRYFWEIRMTIYDGSYDQLKEDNVPVVLTQNKTLGFTLGYCDNDETKGREHFILSTAGQEDSGWITSEKFGTLTLIGK